MADKIQFISKDLTDAVKTAINMEDEGYALYIEAAGRSKNALGRSTLRAIAEKELLHKKAIENFYNKLTGLPAEALSLNDETPWSAGLKKEVLSGIRDSLAAASAEEDLTRAYRISMELERKGYEFYKKIASSTDNADAKKLFDFLASEENLHYEILEETLQYLSNPAEWFHKEEKWLVEG